MKKPILNIDEAAPAHSQEHGAHFAMRMVELGGPLGSKKLGANVTLVPPGKAAFPFHHHYANEEHFFVLRGRGVLRYGDAVYPVKPGDYIVIPAGGPEHAHQLVNTGSEELAYLGLSSMLRPEVVGYADSHKTGVAIVGFGEPGPARFLVDDAKRDADYWDREDGAAVAALVDKEKQSR
jgi:uncharacterized cupin superfamily protein